MEMRFYWICDRIDQAQFRVYFQRGGLNLSDYNSKHYPPAHHIQMQPQYLHITKATYRNVK